MAARVLVVLSEPPLLEGGAAGRCAVALLRGLRGHGIDVSAIAARSSFAAAGTPPSDLPVHVVEVPTEARTLRLRLENLRRPLAELGRPPFGDAVRTAARDVDVVHLDQSPTTWCAEGVAAPRVVHVHYRALLDRSLGRPWTPAGRETALFAALERSVIRRHDHLVASSPIVAASLRRARPGLDVTLAPLGLDPVDYPLAPLDGPPRAGIVVTGWWQPNRDAVAHALTSVWPLVRAAVPEATFAIAGRRCDLLGLPDDLSAGVEVVGEVPSSRAFLRGLSLLLNPLRRGSGMKLKVLEALACGLPVVTTPAGTEGIDGGEGVVVASEPLELAQAAIALLADPEERAERGAAGRRAFLERHAPGPSTEPLVQLYHRLV